jgi:sugar phosphate isomerase/epimerase
VPRLEGRERMNPEKGVDGPQLGLNMHPRWLGGGTAGAFLFPLRNVGLSVLEFTLNLSLPDWPEMSSLIEECRRLGFRTTFHAPYKGPYNPTGFSGTKGKEIKGLYRPAIENAARIAEEAGPITLVVHGAKGDRPREEMRRDTAAFLAWILDKAPGLHVALELLVRERNVTKIGDNKAELVEIVSGLSSSSAGICWDLGHDARNGSKASPHGFIHLVKHVHVHDISPDGEDHCPLIFGNVPYVDHLHRLGQVGYRGTIILEMNGYRISRLAAAKGVPPFQILRDSFGKLTALTSVC